MSVFVGSAVPVSNHENVITSHSYALTTALGSSVAVAKMKNEYHPPSGMHNIQEEPVSDDEHVSTSSPFFFFYRFFEFGPFLVFDKLLR